MMTTTGHEPQQQLLLPDHIAEIKNALRAHLSIYHHQQLDKLIRESIEYGAVISGGKL